MRTLLFVAMLLTADRQAPDDMLHSDMGRPPAAMTPAKADPKTLKAFTAAYDDAGQNPRPVFERYLPQLGPAALLDFLERRYPYCHEQSHELGKAIYAQTKNIGTALRLCGTRCTSGCMHGVVGEAFGSARLDDLRKQMNGFCNEGVMAELHKPGNCAHGLGHAFMFVTGRDVPRSIEACMGFTDAAMQYYCATGVYMELLLTGKLPDKQVRSLHYPCDEAARFPAACYRYKGPELRDQLHGDRDAFAAECESLSGARRLGCFHGLGVAFMSVVNQKPASLAKVCATGTLSDQQICIEGAIEKLADYDEAKARLSCESVSGEAAKTCNAAVREKMYSLTKSTLSLYQ